MDVHGGCAPCASHIWALGGASAALHQSQGSLQAVAPVEAEAEGAAAAAAASDARDHGSRTLCRCVIW